MISNKLIEQVLSGNTVLFLGAGASAGSILENGDNSPLGNKLAKVIYESFYPKDKYENEALVQVSSMVNAKFGKENLHTFLYNYFKNIKPSNGLKYLSQFKWYNIYTTNIDQAIEEAYKQENLRAQKCGTIIGPLDLSSSNRFEEVNLYKLHGCISRRDEQIVFSLEEYATSKEDHLKLFSCLSNDLVERSVIFIGYSMIDSNFQEVWNTIKKYCRNSKLSKLYYVSPYLKQPNIDYLEYEGFEVYNMSNEDFSQNLINKTLGERKTLDDYYTQKTSYLPIFQEVNLKLEEKYNISENYEFPLFEVNRNYPSTNAFYKGLEATWGDIKVNKDGERDLLSSLLENFDNWINICKFDFWLITGKAGDGKTTLLKRLAYQISLKIGNNVLFAKNRGDLDPTELILLQKELNKPLIVLIDNIVDQVNKINKLLNFCKSAKAKILIIGAARSSDWNIYNMDFSFKPNEFLIESLSDKEIGDILVKLENNNALDELEKIKPTERFRLFKESSSRILLVALREITSARKFDDIIVNEYAEIKDEDAQKAYLYVCFINQFRNKFPQSLLIRTLNFDLTQIYKTVFIYTTDIIYIDELPDGSDFLLRARHPIIAEIVVRNFLNNDVKKFEILQNLMQVHIPSYPYERDLVIKLVHNSTIGKIFDSEATSIKFYEFLSEIFPHDYFILQQEAIYFSEIGDFESAREAIEKAINANKYVHPMISHTKGTIILKQSLIEDNIDKSRYLLESGKEILINNIRKSYKDNSYNYHSLINHMINWYKKFNKEDNVVLEEIQSLISEASLAHPYDHMILTECGKFNRLLDKADHALGYFQKAIEINPRNSVARYLLARILFSKGENKKAYNLCQIGTKMSYDNIFLNRLQMQLLHNISNDINELKNEYEKLINETKDDDFLKLMYAAYLFCEGDKTCDELFANFRDSDKIRSGEKYIIQYDLPEIINKVFQKENGFVKFQTYSGYFIKNERFECSTYAFLNNKLVDYKLKEKDRISYSYNFSYNGPIINDFIIL